MARSAPLDTIDWPPTADDLTTTQAPPAPRVIFVGPTTADGVPLEQILRDRPDVYAAFFREFNGANNDAHSSAWLNRVGGATPEAYANYWYETYGKMGEYSWSPPQGAPLAEGESVVRVSGRLTSDGLSIDQLLRDRPDVQQAYFEAYLGPNNDPHSSAWMNRVGGSTLEDYANYWYETYGKHGEYGASVEVYRHAAAVGVTITDDGVSLQEILSDRPDVFRAFFREYYGEHNDRHSSAWVDRVGGETPEAYANYWYKTYAKAEGYVPTSLRPAPSPIAEPGGESAPSQPAHGGEVIPGTDALGNPMPGLYPAGDDLPPSPIDEASEVTPGTDTLGDPLPGLYLAGDDLPSYVTSSGDDFGGVFLPRT